jgi:hypothetical protein
MFLTQEHTIIAISVDAKKGGREESEKALADSPE